MQTALLLSLALPMVASCLVALFGRRPNLRESSMVAVGVVLFGIVCGMVPSVMRGDYPEVDLFLISAGDSDESNDVHVRFSDVPVGFKVEPLGMVFGMVASGLWVVTTVYAVGYMRGHHEQNQTRFFFFFSLAITGALGVAFARNVLTLFIFYEFLTLSTYPLVTHHRDEKARRAGRVYLGILISTSVALLLLAMMWTYQLTGTLEFTRGGIFRTASQINDRPWLIGVLLGLYAFGTAKAALMPFHRWLPAAMVAPTPVSALLHAVAVVKAGVFTVLKVSVYVFGIEYLNASGMNVWLMYVAGGTLILASLIALSKDNLKERLAYSTISQLSYIVLGAALATRSGAIGGGMHIAMHAMGKITLFFCAGAIMVASHKTQVSQLDGLGRRMPFTMAAFAIGALSVIGVPPMGGAWSKWYLALGTAEVHQLPLLGALMISSLLNIAYLMPIPVRAFLKPKPPNEGTGHGEHGSHGDHGEAPLLCVVPLCLTAAGCIVLFLFGEPLFQLVQRATLEFTDL